MLEGLIDYLQKAGLQDENYVRNCYNQKVEYEKIIKGILKRANVQPKTDEEEPDNSIFTTVDDNMIPYLEETVADLQTLVDIQGRMINESGDSDKPPLNIVKLTPQ